MRYEVVCGDFRQVLDRGDHFDTVFMDPPDNIGLGYDGFHDGMVEDEYRGWLADALGDCVLRSRTTWISFNARHVFWLSKVVDDLLNVFVDLEAKPCVQVFSFGQHRHTDLGNNHRPLWRLRWKDAPLFPDAVRVRSWRQENGDKRADPRGRVPGDVFDFARVTGNSKQRRRWHPTQLHEGLVERCLMLTTPPGGSVFDPFAGTGTTLRVCKRLGYSCITSDVSEEYCRRIRLENEIEAVPNRGSC